MMLSADCPRSSSADEDGREEEGSYGPSYESVDISDPILKIRIGVSRNKTRR